ncbi:MAG: hypothetical protein ACYC0V_04645 [Armatimonadota bacterium]
MSICLSEWLSHLDDEYLAEYIPEGGAAVKVAVTLTEDADVTKAAVADIAKSGGFFVAEVDAGITRVHMIQEQFFIIARQVNWSNEINRYLRSLFIKHGINVLENQLLDDIDSIAELNDRPQEDVFREMKSLIANTILRDYQLCREFRTAMAHLCHAQIDPQSVAASDAEVIMQWLQGEKVSLSELKRLHIFSKIGRHNARLMIRSLSIWQHYMGYEATVLILDLHAILAERCPCDHEPRYTRNSVLDTYEMLRTYIDDTDELSYLLLIAVIGYSFIDHPKLGQDIYTALKARLVNEVHDRTRDNPLNAMVSLSLCGEAGDYNANSIN